MVSGTEWQRPIVFRLEVAAMYHWHIDIGFVKLISRARGQRRVIRPTRRSRCATVRRNRIIPLMPCVSAIVCLSPYFSGMSKSAYVA